MLKTKPVDDELKQNYFNELERIERYKERMKNEAFDLIKKYFYALWD